MAHRLDRDCCKPVNGQRFLVDGTEFVLGGAIGDGAVGLVRKATRTKDNAQVAIKFLAPYPKYIEEAAFDDVEERFRREGQRGANLKHAHLIKIYSYNENKDGGCFDSKQPQNPFIVMEHMDGRTLESYIKKYQPTGKNFDITQEKLHCAIQIARALEELHQKRLVHRDVKPANIFISGRRRQDCFPSVKIGDFGVVKWGDFHSSVATGTLTMTFQKGLGTMKYMSPEQAITPKDVTASSDIYSLGITLFELFTGQILASPHHVFEITHARMSRGHTVSRYYQMGYGISSRDEDIAGIILEMHLRGISGRPKVAAIRGRMEYEYERRYGHNWDHDLS